MATKTLRVPKTGMKRILNSTKARDMADLELAKSRRADGEYTSLDEYMSFLNNLINEAQSRKKGL